MAAPEHRDGDAPPAELPPQHAEHAETVAALRARTEHELSPAQRLVEAFTARVGRPSTIAALFVLIAMWVVTNAWLAAHDKASAPDPPPFFWLQGTVALYAALISTFVLATQNREKRHAEQRAYLELQVNLLAEQKTAKIIELIEELRRDMPAVADRVDPQADALQQPVDTAAVLHTLEDTMETEIDATVRVSNQPAAAPRGPGVISPRGKPSRR